MSHKKHPENQNRKSFLEEKLKEKNKAYFSLYEYLRNWANAQWKDHTDIFEQIRHGISHSEKLHEFADILLEKQISLDVFDEKEIFLILSALYLHDVGMQEGWKEFLGIQGSRGYLTWDERKKGSPKRVVASYLNESQRSMLSTGYRLARFPCHYLFRTTRKKIRINHAKTSGHVIRSFKDELPKSFDLCG